MSTALSSLPPSVGDAPVAAVLLRDLAAELGGDEPGHVDPARVEVDDDGRFHLRTGVAHGSPVDLEHAGLAAPELFGGAAPDARSDVYAAACLALTRYLGASPVPAPALGARPSATARLAAQRQAQRTVPARLGALPAPFRAVFARAVAKERHLRPTPATLVAELDAAFATLGGDAPARTRVHRLIVLARVFEPGAGSDLRTPPAVTAAAAPTPVHLPIRTLPALRPTRHAARIALIAAVTVVATGGVAVAAVVGLSSGSPNPTPQAIETLASPSTSASSASPVASTSSAAPAPATSAAPVAVDPVDDGGQGGTGSSGSGDDGSGAGSGRSAGSGGSGHGSGTGGTSRSGGSGSGRGSGSGGGGSAATSSAPQPPAVSTPAPVDTVSSEPPASSSTPPSGTPRPTVSGTTVAPPPTSATPSSSSPATTSAAPTPTATPTSSDTP